MKKITTTLCCASAITFGMLMSNAQANTEIQAVSQVDLKRYGGQWYEIARKPLYFQKKCAYNVTANYTINAKGNVDVDNRCYTADGKLEQSMGEAFVQNPPANSKLKVSFLPQSIRWLPVARGDYWVLKLDENYQHVLVGGPDRKYLWLLSRSQQPSKAIVNEYLSYAQSLGYDLTDLIQTPQK
jgi:apolipoprotein D and lipocalin family protein